MQFSPDSISHFIQIFFLCYLPSVRENNFDTHKNNKENNSCEFHSLLSQTVHSKIKDTGPKGKKNSSKLNCLQFLREYKFNFLVPSPHPKYIKTPAYFKDVLGTFSYMLLNKHKHTHSFLCIYSYTNPCTSD